MNRKASALRHTIFARHSSPWSAWTRWLSTPLTLVPVWTRKWSHGAVFGAWMALNPVVFPKPPDDSAWATRAILGEERWIAERPKDAALAVNTAGTVMMGAAVLAARKRKLVPAVVATCVQMGLVMAYWEQMARYYETHDVAGSRAQLDPASASE